MRIMTRNELRKLFSDYRYWRNHFGIKESIKQAIMGNPYYTKELERRTKEMK